MLMNNIKMCHVPFPGLVLHSDGLNDGRKTYAFQVEPKEFTNSESMLLTSLLFNFLVRALKELGEVTG